MTVKEYWDKVNEASESLPQHQDVFLIKSKKTSTGAKAGMLVEVNRATAAKFISEGSHELASDAEVEQYKADQVAARQAIIDAEYEKKQTVNLRLVNGQAPQIDRNPPASRKPATQQPDKE